MRAVARGAEAGPGMGSPACPRRVRWADGELLDGAIGLWPLPVQTLCSFVDRDRALRWTGGGPRTGPAAAQWRACDRTRGEGTRQPDEARHGRTPHVAVSWSL
jgi:hypothetical protein